MLTAQPFDPADSPRELHQLTIHLVLSFYTLPTQPLVAMIFHFQLLAG